MAVRWYCSLPLSAAQVVRLLAERHIDVTARTVLSGYTTQPIERSHVPIRDRLRGTRGLRVTHTGQKFLEIFEALHALRRGRVKLRLLVPTYRPTHALEHEQGRTVMAALAVVGTQLKKAA